MKKLKIILQSNITYVILFVFILLFIIIKTILIKYESNYTDNKELIGIVTDLHISEDKVSFVLKSNELIKCNYYVKDNSNYVNLLGKKVKISGIIKEVYNNTIPNTFNYKRYLYNNKIYNSFTISNLEIINEENILYNIKNKIIKRMNSFDDNIKTYLNLFIFGDKTYLDNDIYNNYRSNGIWHLFAVSGTHISLIILIFDKLLKRIKFKNMIISLILLYFMFLSDFAASVLRATIFYYLSELLKYFDINISSIKRLFLTAFLILIVNPFIIYNIGFLYSFIISFAIMYENKKITGNYFLKIFKISIISFLVSLPITINLNYEINILSILLNVFYVPFISLIVFPVSILTFIFPNLEFFLNILINILEVTNMFFNSLKINIIMPKMFILIIIIYYIILYIYSIKRTKIFLILLILILGINKFIPKLDNNYCVYYLDVGQGDSTILLSPYKNEVVMIDTGGLVNSDYEVSDNTITFLKSLGISKLDLLIITHGDYDHMGDSLNIINNLKVDKVILNNDALNELELNLINLLEEKNISYYQNIKKLNFYGNKLYFLNNKLYDNENDNSNVIYLEIEENKLLFMGDAGVEVEKDLIEKYNLDNIDVLKVGHHGSKTSSSKEFINEIKPKYSIISVGKNNRYGHPNDNVLKNLEDSKIYRTDLDGSIMFKFKNNKLEIETYSP